jgi:hypothetical protein
MCKLNICRKTEILNPGPLGRIYQYEYFNKNTPSESDSEEVKNNNCNI